MDKEQYNQFDDFFREAAANETGPVMPEAAWQQMEVKLDGQKKRRRFIIWWWWLGASLLLAGGLSFYALRSPHRNGELADVPKIDRNSQSPLKIADQQYDGEDNLLKKKGDDKAAASGSVSDIRKNPVGGTTGANQRASLNPILQPQTHQSNVSSLGKSDGVTISQSKANNQKRSKVQVSVVPSQSKIAGRQSNLTSTDSHHKTSLLAKNTKGNAGITDLTEQQETAARNSDNPVGGSTISKSDSLSVIKPSVTDSLQKNADSLLVNTKPETKKADQKIQQPTHFYLFATGSPEWTFVSGRGSGSIAVSYGGGIGYAFNSHWSVQTGLYRSGKKYAAGEGDYKPKPGSYYDNPNIQIESVAANCAVWEIPLSLRYVFNQGSRSNFFAMVSIQSAIMKKETYDYDYKRYGNPAYSSHTYRTNAFNLFSGFGLAAGYERILNKKFSILATPYFNFPLKGIGEGSINLHSYGLQVGLKYNLPF